MTIPPEQINTVAEWWTFQLRRSKKHVTPDQADQFEAALRDLLPAHLEPTWCPDDPIRGSVLRCLCSVSAPGTLLSEVAKEVGIPAKCPPFPDGTLMWINPDAVKVRHGYGRRFVSLWASNVLSEGGGA